MAHPAATSVERGSVGERWSPARIFLAISAAFHIPVALVQFAYDLSFPIGAGEATRAPSQKILGFVETNGWHTVGALIVGLVSLYFTVRPRHARPAALALGASHVFLFVSLILWDPSKFWLASNWADQVVHASTAVGGITTAMLTVRRMPSTSTAEA
jgi:uncharacterized protein DUF4383